MEEHKSHNIGTAHCIAVDVRTQTILAVQSLQRRRAIEKIKEEVGPISYKDALKELEKRGILQGLKPDLWGPPGGRIEWWKVERLREEYKHLGTEERHQFEESVRDRILASNELLEEAADSTSHYEMAEESGLLIKKARFLKRVNDTDRSGVAPFYPRFWYYIEEVEGSLLEESGEEGLSSPLWIPLQKLHSFFPVHAEAVKEALRHLIKAGKSDLMPSLEYLEQTFRPWKPRASKTEEQSWEAATRGVVRFQNTS